MFFSLRLHLFSFFFFFFNDTATTEIYTLSLHDALPICFFMNCAKYSARIFSCSAGVIFSNAPWTDRKSTRLNSSHQIISYAVFCLKKKKESKTDTSRNKYPLRTQSQCGFGDSPTWCTMS